MYYLKRKKAEVVHATFFIFFIDRIPMSHKENPGLCFMQDRAVSAVLQAVPAGSP